jgi:hypothetical protein
MTTMISSSVENKAKQLDDLLTKLDYKTKEPFKPNSKVVIFENGQFIRAVFVEYSTKCKVQGKNKHLCKACSGLMLFIEIDRSRSLFYLSGCNIATWNHAHRRVFLADDPIVDLIRIHFNF